MPFVRRERIEAEVEFKPKGLAQLQSKWLDFAGDLVEPVALLAAGATKVEAAWAGVRGMFLTRVLGPLGMVAGAAAGLLLTTKRLTAEWSQLGLRGAATLERMTLQFRPLLGSMSLARQRVRELFEFTARTPFQLGESASANKVLEGLTRGALSTREGMMLVGDAAAVSGAGLEETARSVGRLYDGLQSGRPVGEAAMRLQEMGLITGQTRNAIESMQAANASGAEIWRVVEKELQRNKGAMEDLSQELTGLESTAADVQQQMEAGFGKGFMEGEKAGIKATTAAMERLTPVAEYFGEVLGTISNAGKQFKAWLVDTFTSLPGFAAGMKVAGMTVLTLTAAIVAASGAMLGKFIAGILSATVASGQLAKSAGSVAAAETIETAVSQALTAAKVQLAAAKAAVARGSTIEAVGATRAAAAHTVAAVRTNALAASQTILRGALAATATGLRFVIVQLRAMAVAIATNPWMLLATALLAVGAILLNLSINAKKAREELEDYQKATRATAANLEAQRRAVQSLTELRKLEANVVRELGAAYRDLEAATRVGDRNRIAAARERVAALEQEKAAARDVDPRSLRKGAGEVELEDFLKEREREATLSREEFNASGVQEQAALAGRRLKTQRERQTAATDAMNAETATAAAQAQARRATEDATAGEAAAVGRLDALRAEWGPRENLEKVNPSAGSPMAKAIAEMKEAEAEVQRIQNLKTAGRGAEIELGLTSGSELARLKTAVALYDEVQSALAGVAAAEAAVAEASKEQRADKQATLDAARRELGLVQSLAARKGVPQSERERQDAGRKIEEIETRRKDDLDPAKIEELRQRSVEAEHAVAQAKLDAEAQVAALRMRGIEAERAALAHEARKLEIAKERGRVGELEYQNGVKLVRAKEAALNREAMQRATLMQLAFEESRLARLAEEARRNGQGEKAKELQAEADARSDRRRRTELVMEAREVTSDPVVQQRYADERLAEEREAREAERRRREQEMAEDRNAERANLAKEEAEMRALGLRRQGRGDEARTAIEAANRQGDEAARAKMERELKEQGFGEDEAKDMAGRRVKIGQADRLLAELGAAGSGRIVADSLASIGGGGGVSGRDSELEVLRRIDRVLQDIEKNTAKGGDGLGVE